MLHDRKGHDTPALSQSKQNMNNANDIQFGCARLSKIMTDAETLTEKQIEKVIEFQKKEKLTDIQKAELKRLIQKRDNPELPAGVKTHLLDVWVSAKYKRKEEIQGKVLEKGNAREETSVTLVSVLTKQFYTKNKIRLGNKHIRGEWDLHTGPFKAEEGPDGKLVMVQPATKTIDTKTSWSAHSYFRAINSPLDDAYWWQGQGYCDLTGAMKHEVAYCLVNSIDTAILAEKRSAFFKLGSPAKDTITYNEYRRRCKQIEINHIFDLQSFVDEYPDFEFQNDLDSWSFDIPMKERLHIFEFDRDQSAINRMHKRAEECKAWMNEKLFKVVPQLLEA